METKTFKRVRVCHDVDPEDPRWWDNVGTMVCWHNRYTLGDEQPSGTPEGFVAELATRHDDVLSWLHDIHDTFDLGMEDVRNELRRVIENVRLGYLTRGFLASEWAMYREAQKVMKDIDARIRSTLAEHYVMLPLYLYDHSGITMNTGGFSCPWDSGQVGFIYVEWEKAVREYGLTDERFPSLADKVERVNEALRTEVKVYDQYLRGDVYGFEVETGVVVTKTWPDGSTEREIDWGHGDSCWGFFGDDPMTNGMADHVDEELHEALREAAYYQNVDEWVYLVPDGSLTNPSLDEDDLLQELNEEVE